MSEIIEEIQLYETYLVHKRNNTTHDINDTTKGGDGIYEDEEDEYEKVDWAEGEWVVDSETGEQVWQPAEGGPALSAEEWEANTEDEPENADDSQSDENENSSLPDSENIEPELNSEEAPNENPDDVSDQGEEDSGPVVEESLEEDGLKDSAPVAEDSLEEDGLEDTNG